MSFVISLRAEFIKLKRSASVYLTVFAAAFGPLLSLMEFLLDEEGPNDHILQELMIVKFEMTGFLILPMFIILICTLLPQMEFKNNAWKQVLSSPQKKSHILLSKFAVIQLLIILFIVLNQVFMFAGATILHLLKPGWKVMSGPLDPAGVLLLALKSYAGLLGLSTFQFWLGLRLKNFIAPIGIGLALWLVGSLLVFQAGADYGIWNPYSLHMFNSLVAYRMREVQAAWVSATYAAIFITLFIASGKGLRMGNP